MNPTEQQMADLLGQPVLSATKKVIAEPAPYPGLLPLVNEIRLALSRIPSPGILHFPVRDPGLPHYAIRAILTREENSRIRFE